MSIFDIFPNNQTILDAAIKTEDHLFSAKTVCVAISGGADSDIVLDLIERILLSCNATCDVHYVWFDTGIEYQATKDHLKYLESRYGITIEAAKPKKAIATSCREYGLPFLSKQVAEYIYRLQKHGFQWENDSYEVLVQRYPNCQAALRWWCNAWGEKSRMNIEFIKWLKDYILENPPDFKISSKCCEYAKHGVAAKYIKEIGADLNIIGVRQAEGGPRATAGLTCFSAPTNRSIATFRPIFYFTDADRAEYEEWFGIQHSDCYTKYGLKRTGCACCPFSSHFEEELAIAQKYEPKLYQAANAIFGSAYDYYRGLKKYKAERKMKCK